VQVSWNGWSALAGKPGNGVNVKKLLVIAAAIAGALLYRKAQESEARKTTWSQSTDSVE
jgi:hypothetical protein